MWIRMTMRKWASVLLPALVLLLFALALNTGSLLKRPFGRHDDISGSVDRLDAAVRSGDWASANEALSAVSRAMTAVRPRIELAAERSELDRFNETLALLRGSLTARDLSASLQHIALLHLLYEDLGR